MRILILADIHGNWAALRSIREPHDLCVCLGDIVDYGLNPSACVDWVRQYCQLVVRGNHDHAAAQRVQTNGRNGLKYLSGETRRITWEKLSREQLRFLGTLPTMHWATLDHRRFLLLHASPTDPLDEYLYADAEAWSRRLERVEADIICVGHTHVPFVLPVGNKLVINPGSVGQPRDGDPRLSYAVWQDGRVEIKRLEYPVDETIAEIETSNLPDSAKRLAVEVLRTGSVSSNGTDKTIVAPGARSDQDALVSAIASANGPNAPHGRTASGIDRPTSAPRPS
ncbi:MAG: metallophosphoesterase family protein [Gemmatales bacterium]|nr:metallophosphatase family protein [Gemmatales bacterium]MDW8175648.1 metallophosphoesterase family protein [Gemmatales bacterium]